MRNEPLLPKGYEMTVVPQPWISVWEQTPELNTRVLVFVNCKPHEHPHTIGAFMFGGNWVLDETYEEATEPTHWMPLPSDPQEA